MPETAAVYWESKVRIYGFRVKTGLTLCSFALPEDRMESWGALLEGIGNQGGAFESALLMPDDSGNLQFSMLIDQGASSDLLETIRAALKNQQDAPLSLDFPVELISFHGPHFQDRYGIVDAASAILARENIPIIATGCAGTSIGIVVPESYAQKAIMFLSETFIVPQSVDK